jgi:DGQHR domain-containing protein
MEKASTSNPTIKSFPALAYQQGKHRKLFAFAVDGRELDTFLTISRIGRTSETKVSGYQRPEIASHIAQISEYLSSDRPILPNSLVVAFDDSVSFEPNTTSKDSVPIKQGTLNIPIYEGRPMPGWIVDGQQRTSALLDAGLTDFHVCIVGFIATSVEEQREQFILVNSTKPLPRSLIYELLPATDCPLPPFFERRKFPAKLLARLNYEEGSPFHHRIKMPTNRSGVIKDNSVLKMIENSLSDGVLYRLRDMEKGEHDIDSMLHILSEFWSAVADVFQTAWELPPRRSRLTHGAGIVSMGFLMDTIADRHRSRLPTREDFAAHLAPLIPTCRWTEGYWDFGPGEERKWNELQNKSNDINLLANFLLVQYRRLVWDRLEPEGTQ